MPYMRLIISASCVRFLTESDMVSGMWATTSLTDIRLHDMCVFRDPLHCKANARETPTSQFSLTIRL